MSNILTVAYTAEGPTDIRFLNAIIRKVFEEISFECNSVIEVYEPEFIPLPKSNTFIEQIGLIAQKADSIGSNVLCVHVDADSANDANVKKFKIDPAFNAVFNNPVINSCKNLVSIVPVHTTEAWMLADKELFKEEIGTHLSDADLGINRAPESMANPKQAIINALSIAQSGLPQRRYKIKISELYQPLGQKLSMSKLQALSSFQNFLLGARESLRKLNYLQ